MIRPYDKQRGPREDQFDRVIDAVGAKRTRDAAFVAIKPGGVIMHIGLQDKASAIDMRKPTLAEITLLGTPTYTETDMRTAVAALYSGAFVDLSCVEERLLAEGAMAFMDFDQGRGVQQVVLLPQV